MNRHEELEDLVFQEGMELDEETLPANGPVKGLFLRHGEEDKGSILLDKTMPHPARTEVLAEEIGHSYYTVGNITMQRTVTERKLERKGREWGYRRLLPVRRLRKAYNEGCRLAWEVAQDCDLDAEYVEQAVDYYKQKKLL